MTLQLPKEKAGGTVPCLLDYYTGAKLKALACCCNPEYEAQWKTYEVTQIFIPIQSILGYSNLDSKIGNKLNRWTNMALTAWFRVVKKLQLFNHTGG